MKSNKSIDWHLVGNLVVVCFSLVSMSISSAQAILRGGWLYGVMAIGWSIVAVTNMWIAMSRVAQQNRHDR